MLLLIQFQSTQPEWAATFCISLNSKTNLDFNPRSPSGLRRYKVLFFNICIYFNPRSPSGLRQFKSIILCYFPYFNPRSPSGLRHHRSLPFQKPYFLFQSTQPEWAATIQLVDTLIQRAEISIHAARVGCDSMIIFGFMQVR